MNHLYRGKRFLTAVLALVMLVSTLLVSASAASLTEAKESLATVSITQTHNGVVKSDAVHNLTVDGSDVYITYMATLQMTDIMAGYLQPRQQQLYDAQFDVHMNVDLEWLDFVSSSDPLTFTFKSTFLKPVMPAGANGGYTFTCTDYNAETQYFTYQISATRSWIAANWKNGSITIPMELIVWSSGKQAMGFSEAAASSHASEQQMFVSYDVSDWQKPITLELAQMKVRPEKAQTVTTSALTWKTIIASGTVDGEFSYVTADVPGSIAKAAELASNPSWKKTLNFGRDNDPVLDHWSSNTVSVLLKRESTGPVNPSQPESPWLNLTDHFAYIIGRPDGYVYPQDSVTRAEVATIFFRMLTDETRNQFWSKTNNYTDVASDKWYNNAISTLSNMGIINGYPDGTFRPMAGITRAEFAKIAVGFFELTESMKGHSDLFTDISGSWARGYINAAYLCSIINGYPDGTFRPQKLITRAEAMTIVNNTLRRTPHKDHLLPEDDMITWPDNQDKTKWYYAAVQEATNSHEYSRATIEDVEQWTEELPVRDWAKFERAWSDANSAANPGEVVDGSSIRKN